MGSQVINNTSGSRQQTTSTLTVGSGEKVAVRLSRFDDGCRVSLKIVGNSVTSYEEIARLNTIFDAVPAAHVVSVVTDRLGSRGGVEGVLETY